MRNLLIFVALLLPVFARAEDNDSLLRYRASLKASSLESDHVNVMVPAYVASGKDAPVETLQCPIPKGDRVKNYTGVQCVWSSIETLGRWAEESRLVDPPLTSRPQCKSYSSPGRSAAVLNSLGVGFRQTYGDKKKGLAMIRGAMEEGRGVLFDVPGHAMVLVHFSEAEDRVCWIDNSDSGLKVQTSTVSKFMGRWGSWVLVVHANDDIAPFKAYRLHIPIVEASPPFARIGGNFMPFPD